MNKSVNLKKRGLHSFKAGGATAAGKYNIPDILFKVPGNMEIDLAMDGYVSDSVETRLPVSTKIDF